MRPGDRFEFPLIERPVTVVRIVDTQRVKIRLDPHRGQLTVPVRALGKQVDA